MNEELGHMFIWVWHKDDPESPWEPMEVTGPYFSRISSEGYNSTRDVRAKASVEFQYIAMGRDKDDN